MNLSTQEILIKSFENYYQQAYEDLGYRVNISANEKLINNFFKHLEKQGYPKYSIGQDFINRFLLFQFEYWLDKDLENKPTLNWFIGKKAIERFCNVEDWEQKSYFVSVNTAHLKDLKQSQQTSEYELEQKKKYHNQEHGFIHCIENTTLYSSCIPCITCKFKVNCKELLKENYPLLFKRRLKNV